jgi:hypothetical protein
LNFHQNFLLQIAAAAVGLVPQAEIVVRVLPALLLLAPLAHRYQPLRLALDPPGSQSEHRNLNLHQTLNLLGKREPPVPLPQW